MLAAETASGGRVASVGAYAPVAAVPGSEVALYNTLDMEDLSSGLGVTRQELGQVTL